MGGFTMYTQMQATEKRLLLQSAGMMAFVAVGGTVMGILSHSQAILVDGIFSFVAVLIKLLMVGTSSLISRETSIRFQFGYWQLEPLVLFTEGAFTFVIIIYAFLSGLSGLLHDGNMVNFRMAVLYASFFTAADGLFYFYVRYRNKSVRSNLVHFDNVSWSVDAAMAAGLMISFAGASLLEYTPWASMIRYVDPVIMMGLSLQMLIPTFRILHPAAKQILGESPEDVHEHVQVVMDRFMVRYHFKDYVSSVREYGNAKIIEIDILIPSASPALRVSSLDDIRNEIDKEIGYDPNKKWVTITFTTTRRWMARDYLLTGDGA